MIKVTPFKQEYKDKLINCARQGLSENELLSLKRDLECTAPDFEYLVCVDENDQVIGYSKTTPLAKGYIKLDDLYVLPNLRRDQNGSVILVAVMQRAVNNLCVGIFAECLESKTAALAFFKARGFTCYQIQGSTHYFTKSLLPMYKHE